MTTSEPMESRPPSTYSAPRPNVTPVKSESTSVVIQMPCAFSSATILPQTEMVSSLT